VLVEDVEVVEVILDVVVVVEEPQSEPAEEANM
jgi:hypothetical protein